VISCLQFATKVFDIGDYRIDSRMPIDNGIGRRPASKTYVVLLALSLLLSIASTANATVVISEVAYSGSGEDNCGGADWVELFNNGSKSEDSQDLSSYVLHDDKGLADEDAMVFAEGTSLSPGDYLILCRGADFAFGIGSDDTVTVLDAAGSIVDSVSMAGDGPADATYSLIGTEFQYTTAATPGAANVLDEPISLEEQLTMRNEAGEDFFGYDSEVFTNVVDINVAISAENLAIIKDHPSWESWVTFTDFSVSKTTGADEDFSSENIIASSGAGSIRVKGQSTNTITACIGIPNVPFNIEFNAPFLGMDQMYLRNHLGDSSYMRDAAAHILLKQVGLPYIRTRPAQLFVNGEYVGYYTLMEAPTQAYVMQRSFGVFDPQKTGLFKIKTAFNSCPMDTSTVDANAPPPDPYYFERGSHRDDTPVLRNAEKCTAFFFEQLMKEQDDLARGFVENGEMCPEAMMKLGRVDRDFGPKDIEDPMKDFLEHYYDPENDDLTDFIDTDQWLQNFAFSAILLHLDSPIGIINNWYLSTTEGGDNWRIVQYDHNSIMTGDVASLFCAPSCGPGVVYWPILRPTCGDIKDHAVVGRVLNSEDNMEKYTAYAREYIEILSSEAVIEELYAYGNMIKEYIVKDPLNFLFQSVEDYEIRELGESTDDYNQAGTPLLKALRVRLAEVEKQLEAIDNGTLPRNGEYDPRTTCPDWRDPGVGVIFTGSYVAEDCAIPDCEKAAPCYDDNVFVCSSEGDMLIADCAMASPLCDSCFPYSRCGGNLIVDNSSDFVESDTCGPELAACAEAGPCFDHSSGNCAFDGSILTFECQGSLPGCVPCFPKSRCGSGEDIAPLPDVPISSSDGATEAEISESLSGSGGATNSNLVVVSLALAGLSWLLVV